MIDVASLLQRGLVCSSIERDYKPVRYDLGFDASVHPEVDAMHKEAQWFLNDVLNGVRPMRWLSLLGGSSVGKSHLARAINDVVRHVRPNLGVEFWSWSRVVSMFRSGENGIIDHLIVDPDVLVLDDVGSEFFSETVRANLLRIVDERAGKWTIITSNLLLSDLGKREARIASRLLRGHNVVCEVKNALDYSLELRKKGVMPVVAQSKASSAKDEVKNISDEERAGVLEMLRAFRRENGI